MEEDYSSLVPSQKYHSTITFILKMHIWKILKKNHKYIPRSRPSSRLYDIFQLEKVERGTGLQWFEYHLRPNIRL